MPSLTIARGEAGVNIAAVRFYERKGLIERPPKGEGDRVYSSDQVARIRFIKEAPADRLFAPRSRNCWRCRPIRMPTARLSSSRRWPSGRRSAARSRSGVLALGDALRPDAAPVWAMVAMAVSVTAIFINSLWGRPRLFTDAIQSVGRPVATTAAVTAGSM